MRSQEERKHSLHCFMSSAGSARLHSLHMRCFSRMSWHAVQICSISVVLSMLPLASEAAVSTICVFTSSCFSIRRILPLTWWVYLLTAVWVIPSRLAASFCFIPYVFVSSFASRARIAGTTDFTATSHGSFIFFAPFIVLWGKVYKHDACHNI